MKKIFLSIIIICISSVYAFSQCAMCRATVENNLSQGDSSIGAGLNAGIIYLMLVPYIIIGTVAVLWFKSSRKYTEKRLQLQRMLKFR